MTGLTGTRAAAHLAGVGTGLAAAALLVTGNARFSEGHVAVYPDALSLLVVPAVVLLFTRVSGVRAGDPDLASREAWTIVVWSAGIVGAAALATGLRRARVSAWEPVVFAAAASALTVLAGFFAVHLARRITPR